MANDIVKLTQALDLAVPKHVHQRRKGEMAEPYVNHVTEVARILAEVTDGCDVDLIVAGLLHDTMEDQDVSYEELAGQFGPAVADLVREVADDMSLDKPQRIPAAFTGGRSRRLWSVARNPDSANRWACGWQAGLT